ncbi:MAG: acetate--CoA ligase family protein [Anaerolineaceae bacterium]|nr:acetate--CoA ligase family protein [Anaerolineaceae bacterium]
MSNELQPFFSPKGAALIGASSNAQKLSYGILENMGRYGFSGAIYPVNPKAHEILGHTCYPDISQVPDPVDLAVIVLPAPATPAVLQACGERGIKFVIIISGGFREVGGEGISLEAEVLRIADQYDMRIIGPNCVGTVGLHSGFNSTFINGLPDVGSIGFVSQSGAVCGGVVDYVIGKGVGFSVFASLGNEADITETDMIAYLADDPNTKVIAAYVEAINDGPRFIEVAKKVTRKKPIVILKSGRTQDGARSVSSHTGSMAGAHAAYQAAFKQSAVIEANTISELFDIAMVLGSGKLPKGNRVAILTNAGGPAALLADSLSVNGLTIPDLSEETRQTLRAGLVPSAQVQNPVDMLGGASPAEYKLAVSTVLQDPNVDIAIPVLVPQSLVSVEDVARNIIEAAGTSDKPVIAFLMGDHSIQQGRKILHDAGIPTYAYPERIGPALGALLRYAKRISTADESATAKIKANQTAAAAILKGKTSLGEADTRPLLKAYGIPVVHGAVATSAAQAAQMAQQFAGKLAMKIVSPHILHKSDVGGILLNIEGADAASQAYEQLIRQVSKAKPDARLEGVLIEQMARPGIEVIIGMQRDVQFGPLLMFGMGGIYVELLTDVSFRVAPLTRQDATEMIMETKAGKLLQGLRGAQPADIDAVVDTLLKLSQLALDFPQINEIEINPLSVAGQGAGVLALDGRVILS